MNQPVLGVPQMLPTQVIDTSTDSREILKHARLAARRLALDVTPTAERTLAELGFDPTFGARPLKRVIQREVADRLALAVLEGRVIEGDTVTVDVIDGHLDVITPLRD